MEKVMERETAEALLDLGLSVPVMTVRLPLRRRPLTLRLTLRRPYLGTQMRMARRWLSMGVSYDELMKFDKEGQMQFLREHGKELSRIVADCICRGPLTCKLFGRLTAWVLRNKVEEKYLLAAVTQFALQSDITGFANIIRLVERTSPTTPRLSQVRKGS